MKIIFIYILLISPLLHARGYKKWGTKNEESLTGLDCCSFDVVYVSLWRIVRWLFVAVTSIATTTAATAADNDG